MEILETFLRKDRFHVRVKSNDGIRTMPRANFVWLQGNPSFVSIPKGYVVHHLNGDQINDDISNLVIMQKFHHAAHHWKQKTITTKVSVEGSAETYCPVKEPIIDARKSGNFRVGLQELDESGNKRFVWVSHDENGMFRSREQAQSFILRIWKDESSIISNSVRNGAN